MLKEQIIQANKNWARKAASVYTAEHQFCSVVWEMYKKDVAYMHEILSKKQNPIILDVGSGVGLFSGEFLRLGYTVHALDISPEMLELYVFRGNGKLIKHCAEAEEFLSRDAAQYDLIMFTASLHHMFDYKRMLELALARLYPGGLLYIFNEPRLRQPLIGWLDAFVNRFMFSPKEAFVATYNHLFRKNADAVLADYYVVNGGLDVEWLKRLMPTVIAYSTYSLTVYDIFRRLSEVLGIRTWFRLIAKK